jgi:hypothetical protein
MRNTPQFWVPALSSGFAWTTLLASDLAPLSSAQLHAQCLAYAAAPTSTEGQLCSAYLRAFIEGSDRVQYDPAKEQDPDESFTERALRTRYGGPTAVRPQYCVNSSVTVDDLIIQLLVQADSHLPDESRAAASLIYATLNRFHRCGAEAEGRRSP